MEDEGGRGEEKGFGSSSSSIWTSETIGFSDGRTAAGLSRPSWCSRWNGCIEKMSISIVVLALRMLYLCTKMQFIHRRVIVIEVYAVYDNDASCSQKA